MKKYLYIGLFSLFCITSLTGQGKIKTEFDGQVITWTNFNFSDGFGNQTGGRYIPELSLLYLAEKEWKLDGEFSLNTYAASTYMDRNWDHAADLKPYRFWLRFSNNQFELRAGLQKINFGSASMLRPLMWFDRMDPRDPLQLTDGVYGLLCRYYFLNNANIWLWTLYGNEDPRGWDLFPGNKKIPEFGGRIQLPAGPGELAFTYHHRNLDPDTLLNLPDNLYRHDYAQDKIAVDGKWDIGPGIWLESVFKHNSLYPYTDKWILQSTLGMDYTFGIGNGLTAGLEHLVYRVFEERLFESGEGIQLTAVNVLYPVSLTDNLSLIIFYSWKDESLYRFINWGRQYDRISLYLMAYWNPEGFDIYPNMEHTNLFSGKGFQLMFTFNH